MVIYANIQTGSAFLNELKLKTKINISIDSISITAYPIMGLSLGTIVVKDQTILINQKLTNTRDSIVIVILTHNLVFKILKISNTIPTT